MTKFSNKFKKLFTFRFSLPAGKQELSTGAHTLRERGFTVIETLVYVVILGIIVSTAIYFLTNIFKTYSEIYAQKEVMINIQHAMDAMTEEIKFSQDIYSPTSAFGQDNGQLSIKTGQNPPTGETTTFTDFYLDNGRIYIKREGQNTLPLTSNQVKINKLRFTLLNPSGAPEGTQIFIEGQYNSSGALQNQSIMNFTTSAIARYR